MSTRDVECPECGDLFKNKAGMESHKAVSHKDGYSTVTVSCTWCGTIMERIPSSINKRRNHFCDQKCRWKWFSGENHPNWEGGDFDYDDGFDDKLKESVRDQYDRRCADCGTHEDILDQRLHVHHIRKYRDFDDNEKANDLSNLIALCPTCHPKWEQITPLAYDLRE